MHRDVCGEAPIHKSQHRRRSDRARPDRPRTVTVGCVFTFDFFFFLQFEEEELEEGDEEVRHFQLV